MTISVRHADSLARHSLSAQLILEHFTDTAEGQRLLPNMGCLWAFERRYPRAAVLDNFLWADVFAFRTDNDSMHRFAPNGMRQANNGARFHCRMSRNYVFDLDAKHILAAGFDHILAAIDKRYEAVFILHADIASA
jgi:hypothetical protein